MTNPIFIVTKFNRQSGSDLKIFTQRAEVEVKNGCRGLKGSELRTKIKEIAGRHLLDLCKATETYGQYSNPKEKAIVEKLHLIDKAKENYSTYFNQLELALFAELSASSDFAKEQQQPPPIKV